MIRTMHERNVFFIDVFPNVVDKCGLVLMRRSLTVLFRFEAFLDVVRVAVVRSTTMAED